MSCSENMTLMSVRRVGLLWRTITGKFNSGMAQMSYRVLDQQLRPFYTWIRADLNGTVTCLFEV